MTSAFRSHVHAGRAPLDKHHLFCQCKQVHKACRSRDDSAAAATPCNHGLAEQCKIAVSGALLSLAAAAFTPYIAPATAYGASSLSSDVPVVSMHGAGLLAHHVHLLTLFHDASSHRVSDMTHVWQGHTDTVKGVLQCLQLDLAKLVPSGREQGLEDKLRGLQE